MRGNANLISGLWFPARSIKFFFSSCFKNAELLCWTSALLFLAISTTHDFHFILCPLRLAGFTWCPGCGLGRSISFLLHLQFNASWNAHPLGIPGLLVILKRISDLIKHRLLLIKLNLNPL